MSLFGKKYVGAALSVALTLVFMAAALLFFAGAANAATITVDDSGGADSLTIQLAINGASPGDTIYVYNGTYNESVTIPISINIEGESNQSAVVNGSGASSGMGVYVTASYVNISGLWIDNFDDGIYIESSSNNNTISSNVVMNSTGHGIYLNSSSNNNITGNTAAGGGNDGIYICSSNNSMITSNTVIGGNGGIYFSSDSNNNTIAYNTITNTGSGIHLGASSNNNTIASNTVTNNMYYSVFVYFSSNNNITANAFMPNGSSCIYLESSSNNSIAMNTVTNSTYGICLMASSNNNTLTSNNIYGNALYGIYEDASADNAAVNNWWGSPSGPYNATSNPNGTGDQITGGITFSPYLLWAFGAPPNYPGAPSITTAAYTDADGAYALNWTASDYAVNYVIYENDIEIFNGTNTTLSYAFTGCPNGTYAYKVAAWNTNGTSANSSEVAVTVLFSQAAPANLPPAPSITTTAYTDGDGNYSVNWSASDYADGYILYEDSTETYNGTALTSAITSKTNGTYAYKVAAWNTNGTSANSSEVAITVDISAATAVQPNLPSATSITTAAYTDADGNYSINWTASTYADAYALYEDGIEIYNGTALTCPITSRTNGTYAYIVQAQNANGTSANSSTVSVIVAIDASAVQPNPPSVPSITTVAYMDTDGNYSINWTASAYATGYILYENGAEAYNGTALAYPLTNKPNGTYAYKMRAQNTNGSSANSSVVTIVVSISAPIAAQPNLPSAPSITTLAYTDAAGNQTLNWTASAYASGYNLFENGVAIYNGTALTYSVAGRQDGNYTYTVRAWNANGTSAQSSAVTITVAKQTAAAAGGESSKAGGFIPGFEVLAFICALGAVFVIARRRK